MRALSLHRLILRSAFAGVNVFVWVLILRRLVETYSVAGMPFAMALTRGFAQIAILYACVYALSSLLIPIAARNVRNSARRSMWYGTIAVALSYLTLGSWLGGWVSPGVLLLYAVLVAVYRAFYRVPYELERNAYQGRSGSVSFDIILALVPAGVGALLSQLGVSPTAILYGAAALCTLSAVPVSFLPEVCEGFSWGYRETFSHLFSHENRSFALRAFCDGLHSGVLFFIWPLTIFLILGSSFYIFGLVLSASLVASVLLRSPIRRLLKYYRVDNSPVVNAGMGISAWIIRAGIAAPVGIVLVDSYAHADMHGRNGVDALSYDNRSDGGLYIDESTVLKELAASLGRISIVLCAALVAAAFSVGTALLVSFIFAAAATGFSRWSTAVAT